MGSMIPSSSVRTQLLEVFTMPCVTLIELDIPSSTSLNIRAKHQHFSKSPNPCAIRTPQRSAYASLSVPLGIQRSRTCDSATRSEPYFVRRLTVAFGKPKSPPPIEGVFKGSGSLATVMRSGSLIP